MQQTTSPEAITLLERKSLIFAWIELENSLITAQDYKDSLSLTQSEEALVQDWAHSYLNVSPSITERNQN